MFIENEIINLFSSVGAKCEIRRYKHCVPTGLKSISHIRKILKLTHKVQLGNRTYQTSKQGYLVLGFLSILDEKSRFGDRSYSGES